MSNPPGAFSIVLYGDCDLAFLGPHRIGPYGELVRAAYFRWPARRIRRLIVAGTLETVGAPKTTVDGGCKTPEIVSRVRNSTGVTAMPPMVVLLTTPQKVVTAACRAVTKVVVHASGVCKSTGIPRGMYMRG